MAAKHHHYTQEEIEWLLHQEPELTYKEIAKAFNERFHTELSAGKISDLMCKRLKVKRTPKGQFQGGPKPKLRIGDEVIKDGYIWVKVDNTYIPGRTNYKEYQKNWRRKSDLVWESMHGSIPKGYFLIYLDKNPLNCDIDNLYMVNRKIHMIMTSNNWYSENKQQTLTALKWCELFYAIKNKRSEL